MRWWRLVFRRREIDRQLDAELRDHVERLTADYAAAGMSHGEARRRARLEFGGLEPVKEACRDARGIRWLDETRQDLRYAFRSLRRVPGFTAVAIATLALGIAAGTVVFSAVDAVVLRALPFDEPDRLVAVGRLSPPDGIDPISLPDLLDWDERQDVFDGLAGFRVVSSATRLEPGLEPAALTVLQVSPRFFDVLRVSPVAGRAFGPGEGNGGRPGVAVLAYGLWQTRFGGRPDMLGRPISIDGAPHEIVGIAPPGFPYPIGGDPSPQLIVPIGSGDPSRIDTAGVTVLRRAFLHGVVGRLKAGIPLDVAAARIGGFGAGLRPLHDHVVGVRTRAWMLLLLGAVACVLLIVCANVANLMLARAITREREVGIRAAMGAGRARLARQFLVESLVLSAIGTVVGLTLSWWGVEILRTAMPDTIPRVAAMVVDVRVVAVAAAAAVVTGLLVGVLPAVQRTRPDLTRGLNAGGGQVTGSLGRRTRHALVIAEVALAVTLLVGAGLFVASFVNLMRVDLGFEPQDVLTGIVTPISRAPGQVSPELLEMVDRVDRLQGVEHAAAAVGTSPVVTNTGTLVRITIPGRAIEPANEEVSAAWVTPDYHRTLRIPLRRGRYFVPEDRTGPRAVAIISEEAARHYFPGDDPVGAAISVPGAQTRRIVGVVADVRGAPEARPRPLVYLPLDPGELVLASSAHLVVRTTGAASSMAPAVRSAAASVLADVPVREMRAFDDIMHRRTAQRRVSMLLLGLFGVLGLVVASVGVYGVMAYAASQRTPEIGVRLALGAGRAQIMWMFLRQAVVLAAIGLTLGTGAAWALSSTAEAFLFDLAPTDARVFAGSLILLTACTCVASALPAWRAATIDPLVALRGE